MVNWMGEVFTKAGGSVKNFNLSSFFNTGTDGITDPKILYDAASNTWFASIVDTVGTWSLPLAVSVTSDPTGSWRLYDFPSVCAWDQPILGVNDDKIVISGTVSLAPQESMVCVLSKNELLQGASTIDYDSFPIYGTPSVHPVQSLSSTTTEYMASAGVNPTSTVQLFSITGAPPNSVSIQPPVNLTISAITAPPDILQPGTRASNLNSTVLVSYTPGGAGFDTRIMTAVWYQGNLWYTLIDGCVPLGDSQNRTCIRLTQVNTNTPAIVQDFDFGAAGQYYYYPALGMDSTSSIDVIYGYSNPLSESQAIYPSLAVTGRASNDPLNSVRQPLTLISGNEDRNSTVDSNSTRYGDYFGAAVDPSTTTTVWVAGQYMYSNGSRTYCPSVTDPRTQVTCWSTYIGSMNVVPDFSITPNPWGCTARKGNPCQITLTLTSLAGFSGTVTLSITTLPSGFKGSFKPSSVTLSSGSSATSVMTISTTVTCTTIKPIVTATSGSLSHIDSGAVIVPC